MPNNNMKTIEGGVTAPQGFVANALSCGIKKPTATRLDLALLYSTLPTTSAGTFTTNKVRAACVRVSQSHIRRNDIRAIIANSGNANACTGVEGINVARRECRIVAKELGIRQGEIAVCSTGVIGLPMPMQRIEPRLPELAAGLAPDKGHDVASAIITSDTREKEIAVEITLQGKPVRLGACCKGAGMICPNMATMFCFLTTDAAVARPDLEKLTCDAVETSFNRITIDGDMSTNDTVLVMANGASGVTVRPGTPDWKTFSDAVHHVMLEMALHIVQDGERVTKFVTVEVEGARTFADARKVAEAVAKSSLVKSSWNGNDPNWGRIVHAVGYSRANVREELIDVDIAGLPACRGGLQTDTPSDNLREAVLAQAFTVRIDLNMGDAGYTVYTTDLSPEYVDFNRSEYAYWNQAKRDGLTK
ncbi:argj: glutamate n-acetyltransferase/amino-acid acetyltransferase [Akkermansia glycaniphila]|uniref:Arginine biosynthesis bifunctional protein ArgJ n=2 Tax=Akkermansia glycaniphila TaxID=1679444 RepID=A0A1C7PAT7_9BACT|nr:bifunctional glutamate N-acetyltransferase/amino-acid acetyltransferase ArgJ [Akkermansia glycaniphila]OCA02454.1 arginine biosynthesis protein ArgJ [Akkermansia glycaniphila]SEI00140.1 argj: glutamate n-acetyltransferase/amino-acid acetyltransferase [Akkermansia glycaniphila]